MHFNQEPSNPSYFNNGSDAKLVWNYTDPDIQTVIFSVQVNDTYIRMMVNKILGFQEHPNIPQSYKGRVRIEGRATLVIKNINPKDNTKFRCELYKGIETWESEVQLIVAGTYYRLNH